MRGQVILDTGPLVAFLNSRDKYHDWAVTQFGQIQPSLLSCEAVVSEAFFLLGTWTRGAESILEMLERKILEMSFSLSDNLAPISGLLKRYANVHTSLADACLVRMAELHDHSPILTLDSDFKIYRKHKRKVIPLLLPPAMG